MSGGDASTSSDTGFAACFQQCCSGIWQKIKEGRRKTQARWLCAISIIGCSFVAITSVTSGCVPTILIAIFTSFAIALGELPFCLGWIPAVKVWSASIAPYLEQYWARALVYSGTGLGWCFAYELDRDCWWIIFWGISLIISGMLYGWAYFRGERFEDEDKGFKSMGIDNDQLRQQAERNATNAAISHVVSQHTSHVAPAPSSPGTMAEQPAHHTEDESVRLVMSSAGSAHDI